MCSSDLREEPGAGEREVLQERDALVHLAHRVALLPERVHEERGRDAEDDERERAVGRVDAEHDGQAAEQDEQAASLHGESRAGDALRGRVAGHRVGGAEVAHPGREEDRHEEDPRHEHEQVHGVPSFRGRAIRATSWGATPLAGALFPDRDAGGC